MSELLGDPDSGPGLLRAMTALVNLLLAGTCPQEIRTILFRGTLLALRKSSGGLRPIAIGYMWCRLASKCASAYTIPKVTSRGAHGLSCSLGFGRQPRHSNVNDIIHRSLNRAGIPAIKEPSGLTRSDGKRPDGQTLIPWNDGRCYWTQRW